MKSLVRNYFKAGSLLFFFAAHDLDDLVAAYARALELGGTVAVFAPTEFRGPWDSCQVVGHRSRHDILIDIGFADVGPATELLLEELQSLPSTSLVVDA